MCSASGRATPGLLSQLAVDAARDIAFQHAQTLGRIQQVQNFGAHVVHQTISSPHVHPFGYVPISVTIRSRANAISLSWKSTCFESFHGSAITNSRYHPQYFSGEGVYPMIEPRPFDFELPLNQKSEVSGAVVNARLPKLCDDGPTL